MPEVTIKVPVHYDTMEAMVKARKNAFSMEVWHFNYTSWINDEFIHKVDSWGRIHELWHQLCLNSIGFTHVDYDGE